MKDRIRNISSSQTIMLGFAFMILVGASLLNLPIASKTGESVGFLNALFTATSANCVTGLVVVNTMEHWTFFGKIVILALIQFGGLGFMAIITIGMILLNKKISLKSRKAIQTSFNQANIGGMVKLVKRVVKITLIFESIGAIILAIVFYTSMEIKILEALFQGIFHSISAFCNAGFDNLGSDSLVPFQLNGFLNYTIMFLIVAGGLGFNVWIEIIENFKNKGKKPLRLRLIHMSLHSKIVIGFTSILIFGGALLFLLFEWSNVDTIGNFNILGKIRAVLFQSVTLRTAGFNTIFQGQLTDFSKALSCVWMLIGGSPASTAGGIKTVTIAVILISMVAALKGKNRLEIFRRTLPFDLLLKAITILMIMLLLVSLSTILLYFTESLNHHEYQFLDLLYEVCSATGTVGLSTGITGGLSSLGKMILIACMYLGRLSPITVIIALNSKLHDDTEIIKLPGERVIIG